MLTVLDIYGLRQAFKFSFTLVCISSTLYLDNVTTTTRLIASSKISLYVLQKYNLYYAGHEEISLNLFSAVTRNLMMTIQIAKTCFPVL